jgi:hypothetical protein
MIHILSKISITRTIIQHYGCTQATTVTVTRNGHKMIFSGRSIRFSLTLPPWLTVNDTNVGNKWPNEVSIALQFNIEENDMQNTGKSTTLQIKKYRNVYIQYIYIFILYIWYIYNLSVHMSTSSVVIHCTR